MIKPRKNVPHWPAEIPGGATALDRARTIARALYDSRHSPEAIEAVAAMARRFGETWLTAHRDHTQSDQLLSTEEVAHIAGVRPTTVRKWAERGHITRLPGGYVESEVQDYIRRRNERAA